MLAPTVMRRLAREVARLQRSPPDGLAIEVGEHDMLSIDGWIQGPHGTPYAGGYFRVHFTFAGTDFPAAPPKCVMKSKIFHPNIHAGSGEICVSTLKKDWSPTYGVEHILTVIRCLLISPNADSALDPEAARLLQDAYEEYAATAAIWTRVHASRRPACLPADTPLPSEPLGCASSSSFLADEHVAKKVDIQAATADISLLSLGSSTAGSSASSGLAFSSQPLARSGSTNINLHHKPSFDSHARRTSNGGTASARLTPSVSSATLNATNVVVAAAATAAAAAMTAAITADLCSITLEDRSAASSPHSTMLSVKTAAASRRGPTVRRGIKRL